MFWFNISIRSRKKIKNLLKKCKFRCYWLGSDKKLIEKSGLHHLPAGESNFCTLRNIRTGLVTLSTLKPINSLFVFNKP